VIVIIEARAFARAGLLGNPSDGYFGKTISIIVGNFGARISLYQTPELCIEAHKQDMMVYKNIYDLYESIELHGYYGGERLIKASIKKFLEYCNKNNVKFEYKNFTIRYQSTIPRQVGLAGSSAIITATFRALMSFYKVKIAKEILPTLILETETGELGINAGLQDRVIQVYEGCVYMDFDRKYLEKNRYGKYQCLDANLLPKLYIAYKTDLSKVSGQVFGNIKVRYEAGETVVVDTLNAIAELALEGKKALEDHDIDTLNQLVNRNFDLRQKIIQISEANLNLILTARACGASAKFAGSGGSIIGIYKDDEMLNRLIIEMKKIRARVIKPYII
jgi:glucuronokinase